MLMSLYGIRMYEEDGYLIGDTPSNADSRTDHIKECFQKTIEGFEKDGCKFTFENRVVKSSAGVDVNEYVGITTFDGDITEVYMRSCENGR